LADVRDEGRLAAAVAEARPEIVFHLAAQPIVRESYKNPVETYATNVLGTAHLLQAVRSCSDVKAFVNVTSDKCYENREWVWGYRESEPLGGYDPYSSSKACSELVTEAYRASFFNPVDPSGHKAGIASARAGNVIGGGDFSPDRLLPDCVRAILSGDPIRLRNPEATRPWQHVLDPLSGYLLLARKLHEDNRTFAGAWNFGPDDSDVRSVSWVVDRFCQLWGVGASRAPDEGRHPHEARSLKLDCSKAKMKLGWHPRWGIDKALELVVDWTKAFAAREGDLLSLCLSQIAAYGDPQGACVP
ncbi:MAG TPA: CDP-glucose 4,6-dehydratase, partial [Candidatus Deferrimicrobium sp.]